MIVSLDEWVQTGSPGPLQLGMTRAEVEQHLGPPDAWTDRKHRPAIWKYGGLEIHFDKELVVLIFMDAWDSSSDLIDTTFWREQPNLTQVAERLAILGVHYRKEDLSHARGVVLVTDDEVRLHFAASDEKLERVLCSMFAAQADDKATSTLNPHT